MHSHFHQGMHVNNVFANESERKGERERGETSASVRFQCRIKYRKKFSVEGTMMCSRCPSFLVSPCYSEKIYPKWVLCCPPFHGNVRTFSCGRITFKLLMSFVPVDWRHYLERTIESERERERDIVPVVFQARSSYTNVYFLKICAGFIILDSQHSNPIILEYYLFNQMLHLYTL